MCGVTEDFNVECVHQRPALNLYLFSVVMDEVPRGLGLRISRN